MTSPFLYESPMAVEIKHCAGERGREKEQRRDDRSGEPEPDLAASSFRVGGA